MAFIAKPFQIIKKNCSLRSPLSAVCVLAHFSELHPFDCIRLIQCVTFENNCSHSPLLPPPPRHPATPPPHPLGLGSLPPPSQIRKNQKSLIWILCYLSPSKCSHPYQHTLSPTPHLYTCPIKKYPPPPPHTHTPGIGFFVKIHLLES